MTTPQTEHPQIGETLDAMSRQSPVLVVLLRHGGCPFCRQMLADLAEKRALIEQSGTSLALVHMMTDAEAGKLFQEYGLDDVCRIGDPDRQLYRAFGLQRGTVSQVMGPRVWWRGLKATLLAGHRPAPPKGDVLQMPGAFLITDGEIVRSYRHETSADRPDFEQLAACHSPSGEPPSP